MREIFIVTLRGQIHQFDEQPLDARKFSHARVTAVAIAFAVRLGCGAGCDGARHSDQPVRALPDHRLAPTFFFIGAKFDLSDVSTG